MAKKKIINSKFQLGDSVKLIEGEGDKVFHVTGIHVNQDASYLYSITDDNNTYDNLTDYDIEEYNESK